MALVGAPPTLGEAMAILLFNLDPEHRAYLQASTDYDKELYAELDALLLQPLDAARLLDYQPPTVQVAAPLASLLVTYDLCGRINAGQM